jgi:hypothetical protein
MDSGLKKFTDPVSLLRFLDPLVERSFATPSRNSYKKKNSSHRNIEKTDKGAHK